MIVFIVLFRLLFESQSHAQPDNTKPAPTYSADAGMPMCPQVIQ